MKSARYVYGFTLIELVVVISILVMLSLVILAVMFNARKESRDTARIAIAQQLSLGIRLYKEANGAYPSYPAGISLGEGGALDVLLAPYVRTIPHDPLGATASAEGFGFMYISDTPCGGSLKAVVAVGKLENDEVGNADAVCEIPDDGRYLIPVY
jgi:prepilin-type N-terminal cleavage/methylation domain-containing protein